MKILVTGAAGFIGAALSFTLAKRGNDVVGIDNLNDYYDVNLKFARLKRLADCPNFRFSKCDITNQNDLNRLFEQEKFDHVINLAAQAGVRYSITNPHAYIQANVVGFMNILECCRFHPVKHLIYASSSSVYGANSKIPFSTHDNVDCPVSLYAATKKTNELMAHTYSHLYQLPTTGLRFFTVYGEWGRPDMSPFLFTRKILCGEAIDVFNYGHHKRDFTYIDDIIEGVIRVIDKPIQPQENQKLYRIYNIGSHQPVELLDFISLLEKYLNKTAVKNFLPMQAGDVVDTYADIDDFVNDFNYSPSTPLEKGVRRFVAWYQDFYR